MQAPNNQPSGRSWPIQAPNAAEALLNALLDNVPDAIFFKDLECRFICVSQALVERSRFNSMEELIGKTDFEIFGEAHARQAFQDEQEILRSGEPFYNKIEKEVWPDGHITWVSTSKMPLLDDSGQLLAPSVYQATLPAAWKRS